MKTLIAVILLSVSGLAMAADIVLPGTLTVGKQTFTEVVYQRHDAGTVYFFHADGAGSVPISALSKDLQTALGYDPALAAQESQERATKAATHSAAIQAGKEEKARQHSEAAALEAQERMIISGPVISVTKDGLIVSGEPQPRPVVNYLQSIGGGGNFNPGPTEAHPRAEGVVFLQGMPGSLADGEHVYVVAAKTDQTFAYTTAFGAAKNIRIYRFISK